MTKVVKEFLLDNATGEVSVEYDDNSTSKYNLANAVTATQSAQGLAIMIGTTSQLLEHQMSEQQIEKDILSKGLTAPRITPSDLDANIADIEIVKHVARSGKVLRWAVLTTQNGFAVVGKPSAAVSVENDNAEVGEKIAIANSREELWPLMGYELQGKLASAAE